MALEIEIDRDVCMGSGQCIMAAPNTFDLDDMSVAIVVDLNGDPDKDILDAQELCPTNAITVRVAAPAESSRSD